MPNNGEIFAQFMQDSFGAGELNEPEQEEKPAGPRRPAPIPEAGHTGGSPVAAEGEALYAFHETLQRFFNTHY